MSKNHTTDLLKFLKPFPTDVQESALWLREFVWDLYPKTNELIYDSYNAVSFGWSLTDRLGQMFCGIGVYRNNYKSNLRNEKKTHSEKERNTGMKSELLISLTKQLQASK